jgi:hypothetical protein
VSILKICDFLSGTVHLGDAKQRMIMSLMKGESAGVWRGTA